TPGHTPGHQSLRVRTEKGEVVVTGDACYFCRTLRDRRLPRFVYDRAEMLASLDRLEALERGGAKLFFGHDPDFWKAVPQAPAPAFSSSGTAGLQARSAHSHAPAMIMSGPGGPRSGKSGLTPERPRPSRRTPWGSPSAWAGRPSCAARSRHS